ncbi:MAG: hypothetical protein IKL89_03420, partial [Clostridia bacterium]|nr:hypothetical protein [Clostridia bacterium]
GTYVYLLGALLGMREEDLLAEYRLSALYHEWLKNDDINALIAELRLLPGDSMQEKVENYLLSLGITAAEIESIQAIYLEK